MLSIGIPEEFLDEIVLECMKEENIDNSKLSAVMNENFIIETEDPNIHKLLECSFEKHMVLNDNGELNTNKITSIVNKHMTPLFKNIKKDHFDVTEKAVVKCKNPEGNTWGVRMMNFHNCVVSELRSV